MKTLFINALLVPCLAQMLDRLLHPLDNILSIQQKHGISFPKSCMQLYQSHGLKGFYTGFKRPLVTFGLARTLMISFYTNVKYFLLAMEFSFVPAIMFCGIFAGAIDATLTSPGENSRTRAVFKMPSPKGFKDNYRGYSALLLRSIFGATIILAGSDYLISNENIHEIFKYRFITAFLTGIVSQIFTSPLDVWKNALISTPNTSSFDQWKDIVSKGHCYNGLPTKMLRMGLGSAIVISTLYALRIE